MPIPCSLAQVEAPAFKLVSPGRFRTVDPPAFAGRLEDLSVPSVLLVLEAERKTGILVLTPRSGGGKSALYLQDGRVVRAHRSSRRERSHASAVYSLLPCTCGTFDFLPYQGLPGDEIGCSTSRLIVEGARRISAGDLPTPVRATPSTIRTRGRRRRTVRGTPLHSHERGWVRDTVVTFFMGFLFLLLLLAMQSIGPRMPGAGHP